jgi:hypothetical protein
LGRTPGELASRPRHPMIAEVRKEPEQQRNIGGGWFTIQGTLLS